MSRWLVGSSSSSRSGCADQRARQQHAPPPAARQRVDDGVGGQLEPRRAPARRAARAASRRALRARAAARRAARGARRRAVRARPRSPRGGRRATSALSSPRPRPRRRTRRARPTSGTSCSSRADAHARLPPDRPRIRRLLAGDRTEQRGLAGAVAADDGDALPGLDQQRDGVEQRHVSIGDRHAVERDERHPTNVPTRGLRYGSGDQAISCGHVRPDRQERLRSAPRCSGHEYAGGCTGPGAGAVPAAAAAITSAAFSPIM